MGVYLSLAGAAGNPIDCDAGNCDYSWSKIGVLGILFVLFYFSKGISAKVTLKIAVYCILYFFVPIFYMLTSSYPMLLSSKIYGGFLGSFFGAYFVSLLLYRYGEGGMAKGLFQILFLVLVVTVMYKIPRGLFDRGVYVFNGPIIFGWLMAMGALVACYLFLIQKNFSAIFYLAVFSVGVVLSFSRGPMVAFAVSLIVMLVADRRVSLFRSTKLAVAMVVALVGVVYIFRDAFFASRLAEYGNSVLGGAEISREVLLGSRSTLYYEGIDALAGNLAFGIGGANFPDYSRFFGYPHNVHFEVLVEYGIFAFLAHVALVVWMLRKSSGLLRALIVLFTVALSLSGDLSYIRYILAFGLPAILFGGLEGVAARRGAKRSAFT